MYSSQKGVDLTLVFRGRLDCVAFAEMCDERGRVGIDCDGWPPECIILAHGSSSGVVVHVPLTAIMSGDYSIDDGRLACVGELIRRIEMAGPKWASVEYGNRVWGGMIVDSMCDALIMAHQDADSDVDVAWVRRTVQSALG